MAANLMSADEVLELIFSDEEVDDIENTDENTHKDSRERLKECLEEFDGGEGFNKHLFTSTAQKMLLPLVEACQNNQ
jgi:hypothetical protein